MNARANTTIFLITQAKTQFFLLAPTILYAYVCGMKKILHMQIKLLFIFILDKGLFNLHNKDGSKIYPPY